MRARPLFLVLVLACGGSDPQAPAVADRVSVSPSTITFQSLGDTIAISVQAITSDGSVLPGAVVSYSSSNTGVATVDASGRVVAVANGSTTVTVTSGPASGVVTVTVAQRPTVLSAAPATLNFFSAGDTGRIVATARDARGSPTPGITATWTSSNPSVATVSGGLVTAVADGTAEVVAGYESLATSTPVVVSRRLTELRLPGDTLVMDALGVTASVAVIARDANGRDLPGLTFTWESTHPAIATVLPNGTLTSVANGNLLVRVRSGPLAATRAVRVRQVAASLEFGASPVSFMVEGESVGDFTVLARDRNNVLLQVGGQIDIALQAPSPNVGQLGGEIGARQLAGGTAAFAGVTIDRSGPAYRLTAKLGTLQVSSGPIDVALRLVSLDSFNDVFCGRDVRAELWCWGFNVPPVPAGAVVATPVPARAGNIAFNTVISFGDGRQCGILFGHTTRCWGGGWGAAPASTNSTQVIPVAAASDSLFCGLVGSGNAWCFGPWALGTRGTSLDVFYHPDSATVTAGNNQFTQLSTSFNSTCGVKANGDLLCWGWNQLGQVGIPSDGTGYVNSPTKLGPVGLAYAAVELSGGSYGCGLTTLGRLFCWGSNADGQFGNDPVMAPWVDSPRFIPSNETFTRLNVGDRRGCALSQGGQAFCWGSNRNGYLGRGNSGGISVTPNPVITPERFVDLAGLHAICGLTARGLVFCWGTLMSDDGRFVINAVRSIPLGTVIRANTVVP